MNNCFEGYLTPACATCECWMDGSDPERGLGCASHYPISWCPHFVDEEQKEALKDGSTTD